MRRLWGLAGWNGRGRLVGRHVALVLGWGRLLLLGGICVGGMRVVVLLIR